MIVGVAAAIGGIVVVPKVFIDYGIMIGFSLALIFVMRTGLIRRPVGVGMTAAYGCYLGWLILFT